MIWKLPQYHQCYMNHNTNLSVIIITLNEEEHMKALLSDLDFADEILVVDSFSTDGTEAISKSFSNVRFIQNKFENFTMQKNFLLLA